MPLIEVPDAPNKRKSGGLSHFGSRLRGAIAHSRPVGDINGSLPDALFGAKDPKYILAGEKPVHRHMVELSLRGFTNREIAEYTKYSTQYVQTVLQQPFAQVYMIESLKKSAKDEMKEILESEVVPTIRKLVSLRDNALSEAIQKSSCDSLLDRYLGKPTQPITTEEKPVDELTADELKQQAEAALRALSGTAVDPGEPGQVGTPQ